MTQAFLNIASAVNLMPLAGLPLPFVSKGGTALVGALVSMGIVASVFIVWMLRSHPTQKLFCFAVSMIMGGALGNVIDRLRFGAVVDFVDAHGWGWHWYVFNIADVAIVARRAANATRHKE